MLLVTFTLSVQASLVAHPPIKFIAARLVMVGANCVTSKCKCLLMQAYELCWTVLNCYFLSAMSVCLPSFNITGKILRTESFSLLDDAESGLHQGNQFEQIDSLKENLSL